jgi:phospholipid/cholesterol/gamma-HCH transport system permease protein
MEVLTVNLVGRLTFRELGVLMTAIMVAGRSGSAFAAQIGTMKLNEEVDAMRTIGVAPMEALVMPRIIAAIVMMPLLSFYSCIIIGVAGCFQGLQVRGNAEEVGQRTTSAVVQAIFLVIVIDAVFAVFFTWIDWK